MLISAVLENEPESKVYFRIPEDSDPATAELLNAFEVKGLPELILIEPDIPKKK